LFDQLKDESVLTIVQLENLRTERSTRGRNFYLTKRNFGQIQDIKTRHSRLELITTGG